MPQDDQTSQDQSNRHFRVLEEAECLELLTTTTVGRVAFVDAEGVQLLPLNYTVIDGEIYFRTNPDTVLAAMGAGQDDVAFEIDHHGEVSPVGWNVTVKGSTAEVTDPDELDRVMASSRLRPWAGGPREQVIHLTRRSIAGRRVRGD